MNYQVFNYVPDFDGLARAPLPRPHRARQRGRERRPDRCDYFATDESASAVTDFTPDELAGATQVCALVAEHEHGVIQQGGEPTGNCVPLP